MALWVEVPVLGVRNSTSLVDMLPSANNFVLTKYVHVYGVQLYFFTCSGAYLP